MPITQAQIDALKALNVQESTLLTALVADTPVAVPPPVIVPPPVVVPPATVPFLDKTHTGVLVSDGGKLGWNVAPWNADAQGRISFMANGSTTTAIRGTKLVLQADHVYAKQPDGTWLLGTVAGPQATTVVVVDPAP